MDAGTLKHAVEVWGMVKVMNELNEVDYQPAIIKRIRSEIVPQTGNLQKQQGVETVLSQVTHKVKVRYMSGRFITPDMWLMYRGQRFNISFILNPYFRNEKLELFCEEVIE
ncbi:phage head closure protein [Paenibacillus sp. MMS18-CY102]|uniref:phage head closure protein n=1 Tax=Paenibacillus sp. MMS18-CY102 TaxID=2682849 RepID=UPI001365A811|nr:phage head closure protein [Paenibacillus sp. MMS18-CY102]MWC26637.1 phage head closure protein [Paenibacillus sp. MMS18-CY102]